VLYKLGTAPIDFEINRDDARAGENSFLREEVDDFLELLGEAPVTSNMRCRAGCDKTGFSAPGGRITLGCPVGFIPGHAHGGMNSVLNTISGPEESAASRREGRFVTPHRTMARSVQPNRDKRPLAR